MDKLPIGQQAPIGHAALIKHKHSVLSQIQYTRGGSFHTINIHTTILHPTYIIVNTILILLLYSCYHNTLVYPNQVTIDEQYLIMRQSSYCHWLVVKTVTHAACCTVLTHVCADICIYA